MDNFEWTDGYNKRFGLHFVNYSNNVTRLQKQSAIWYANYINKYNVNAQYKGPTLQPNIMPSEYGNMVCPTPQPTGIPISQMNMSTTEYLPNNDSDSSKKFSTIGMVFIIIGVLVVVLLLAFIGYKLIVKP